MSRTEHEIAAAIREAGTAIGAARLLRYADVKSIYYRAKKSPIIRQALNERKGAGRHHPRFIDMKGQQRGTWTVLERVENSPHGNARWKCKHNCGAIRIMEGIALRAYPPETCSNCKRKEARVG